MDMPPPHQAERTRNGQQVARVALAIGLAALGLYVLQGFLRALVWAAILAIATWPLYQRTQQRFGAGRRRVLLPLLFTAAITLTFVIPLALVVVQLSHEAWLLAGVVVDVRAHGMAAPDWLTRLPVGAAQATELVEHEPALTRRTRRRCWAGSTARGSCWSAASSACSWRTAACCSASPSPPCSSCSATARDLIAIKSASASRRMFGPNGERVGQQIIASVHGTVDGLVLVGLGIGAVLGVGYWIAGAPHPVLLGALTAVAATVPLGSTIVLAAGGAAGPHDGHPGRQPRCCSPLVTVVIFIADHAIRPALIGGTTRLPFIWVLLGILGGGRDASACSACSSARRSWRR